MATIDRPQIKSSRFKPATREKLRLRMAIEGPSGSGKTFTALRAATALGETIAVINTESKSIQKYIGEKPDGVPFEFAVDELTTFAPSTYTESILEAGKAGFDVLIIDSLSHAWEGEGGALDQVDRSRDNNRFTAWKDVTPQHRRMIDAILRSPCHVIVTMRTKTEYVVEANAQGKMAPKKIGMKPIQREGMEYEFDVVADMNVEHVMTISKTRCSAFDGLVVAKPGKGTFLPLVEWLEDGIQAPDGYYTADESDLKAQERAERAQKSPEELRAEGIARQRAALAGKVGAVEGAAAAGATAAPAPAVTATPQAKSEATVAVPPKPAATKPEPRTITTATLADEALKTKVRAAWTATGKPKEEFASHVAAYGKAKLSDLTQIEADDLLGRLLALDPNATKDSARVNGMEANAGTSTDETPVAAKTQAGEQPVDGGNAEGAKDGLVLPDDPFAALSVSYGTSTPEQRAEFESLAKELKWSPAAFFKRNRTPVIGQMSAQVAARGLALLALYKTAGEAKVMEAAEATFGTTQSTYEYTGAQLKYLAGVLACPF
jgi:hypothetical protein